MQPWQTSPPLAQSAIRRNIDTGAETLPDTLRVQLAGINFYLLHDLKMLGIKPTAEAIDVVISGHSHKPRQAREQGLWYFSSGSPGRRRFSLPVILELASIANDQVDFEPIDLLDAQ